MKTHILKGKVNNSTLQLDINKSCILQCVILDIILRYQDTCGAVSLNSIGAPNLMQN